MATLGSVITKEQIEETLKTPSTQGKRLLEPLKAFSKEHGVPVNVLEDNAVSNES